MPIVPAITTLSTEQPTAVLLPEYPQILGISECSFYGVNNTGDVTHECRNIWIKSERDIIARYLAEAQAEIEAVTGYPLAPTWFTDEPHVYRCPLLTKWGRVIAGGIRATHNLWIDAPVDHGGPLPAPFVDPATVTLATTVTDPDEIHVYYPASLGVEGPVEIYPSDIDIAGGVATISIPRCRLVLPSLADNDRYGIDYDTISNFLDVVDVIRVYNDPSVNATLVYPHSCSGVGDNWACTCGEYTHDACIYVRSPEIGSVDVMPGSYAAGWTSTGQLCLGRPQRVRLNYRAGMIPTSRQAKDAVVRLAHAKMPQPACACDDWRIVWQRDTRTPEIGAATREMLNNPFGTSAGSWIAWRFANAMRLVRGGVL